jgi:hypothetical protein
MARNSAKPKDLPSSKPKAPPKKEAVAKSGKLGEKATKPALEKAPKPSASVTQLRDPGTSTGVVDRSKYSYVAHRDQKTASGRTSVDNDDPIAAALRGKTASEAADLVEQNGGTVNPKWAELNEGLARMSAGNVLRKLAKRTEGVKIDGKRITIAA